MGDGREVGVRLEVGDGLGVGVCRGVSDGREVGVRCGRVGDGVADGLPGDDLRDPVVAFAGDRLLRWACNATNMTHHDIDAPLDHKPLAAYCNLSSFFDMQEGCKCCRSMEPSHQPYSRMLAMGPLSTIFKHDITAML